MLRVALARASQSRWLAAQVTSRSLPRRQALRFIAGDTLEDGLRVAAQLAADGRMITLDYVGEHVDDETTARFAAKVYRAALEDIGARGLPAGLSVKPTQLGLHVGQALCEELLAEIAQAAATVGAHVTLDMEDHLVTEATIVLVERMHAAGHTHVGCALQAYLHRTYPDVRRLSRLGASVRLCKGAYAEPSYVAFQRAADVNRSFVQCAEWLLGHGAYPRIATHDHRLVAAVKHASARCERSRDDFELQMLYGVRPDMQEALVRDGYRLRVYVPFGSAWYPHFMRRLAERPANLAFFVRALRKGS
jgi:proline dehydrogenase